MSIKTINQTVSVTAVRFNRHFEPIPKRIEFGGRSINFVDDGIRFNIGRGNTLTKLFDMTDGLSNFRLRRQSGEPTWELVSITS